MDLATRLRQALEELELSQAELARRTGISRGTVNKIVNAKREPNAAQLGLLAHELGLELDELVGEAEQEDELELIEQQLRKALLRAQRSERARAEQAKAAKTRERELQRELEHARAGLDAERGARAREREELRASAREAHARVHALDLRVQQLNAELAHARRERSDLRQQLASLCSEPRELPLDELSPSACADGRAEYSTARALGQLVAPLAGFGFTEMVLALALHKS